MIERYTDPEMGAIWTEKAKYESWWKVELAAMAAMAELGIVPNEAYAACAKAPVVIDPLRIAEIEATTKHDIIAFLTHIEEQIGEPARYVHYGMTSSDVLDTALATQLAAAVDLIERDLEGLRSVVRRRAFEHKMTPMIGRSHGIHAEPITFGLVLAIYYDELGRHVTRLRAARQRIAVGMISGAVGTFANTPPEVEERACAALGLKPAPASNQIIQRDRHAELFMTIALLGATVEKIAVELRHLQRTEVREVEEAFSKGQKGSSAMPHKRNPISAENLSGLARLLRGNALAALENVPLWHERDISHSSVERVIAPDSTILAAYMLKRLTRLLDGLVVYPEAMMKNLNQMRGLVFSQRILLELVAAGLPRQKAYEIVQRGAMRVWAEPGLLLKDALLADEELVAAVGREAILRGFELSYHLKHVDTIFTRVFGEH